MGMEPRDNGTARRARAAARWRGVLPLVLSAAAGCRPAAPVVPTPPTGGTEYVYDAARFAADVAPVFSARGCDTIECHGGGIRGTFALSPVGDKDLEFDFAQAVWQADGDEPASSPLLRKPLAVSAGGAPHAGDADGGIFASTADPDYQAILAWITAGDRP